MSTESQPVPAALPRRFRRAWLVVLAGVAAAAVAAWLRVGMLDLPPVPVGLTLESAGLAGLSEMKALHDRLWSTAERPEVPPLSAGAALVQHGLAAYRRGESSAALVDLQAGLRLEPDNLVLANAYRMVVFQLRRNFLAAARRQGLSATTFPAELDRQPMGFFESLDRARSTRETKLNLALAWVDEMLLFPALEIKAPASVESVDLLTGILGRDNAGYVPALFARGMNHLHRPARLVWPESAKTPADAAAQDLGRCVAIGRRLKAGSPRLQATLALSLGDAYVKAGRFSVARSWWQLAQNLCRDPEIQNAVRRRYAWRNEEILDRLEDELDRSRGELDHPMTDLALMWN